MRGSSLSLRNGKNSRKALAQLLLNDARLGSTKSDKPKEIAKKAKKRTSDVVFDEVGIVLPSKKFIQYVMLVGLLILLVSVVSLVYTLWTTGFTGFIQPSKKVPILPM